MESKVYARIEYYVAQNVEHVRQLSIQGEELGAYCFSTIQKGKVVKLYCSEYGSKNNEGGRYDIHLPVMKINYLIQ